MKSDLFEQLVKSFMPDPALMKKIEEMEWEWWEQVKAEKNETDLTAKKTETK